MNSALTNASHIGKVRKIFDLTAPQYVMLNEKNRVLGRDLKFLLDTGSEPVVVSNKKTFALRRLYWGVPVFFTLILTGWLTGSPVTSNAPPALYASMYGVEHLSLINTPSANIHTESSARPVTSDLGDNTDVYDEKIVESKILESTDVKPLATISELNADLDINSTQFLPTDTILVDESVTSAEPATVDPVISQSQSDTIAAAASNAQQQTSNSSSGEWRTDTIKKGDTLGEIFVRHGLPSQEAIAITKTKGAKQLKRIKAGDTIWLKVNQEGELEELKCLISKTKYLVVSKIGTDPGVYKATEQERHLEVYHRYVFGEIKNSLYRSGIAAGLSEQLIYKLGSIYRWNIDFAKDLQNGDRFLVIFEELFDGDEKVMNGEIVAAEFNNAGNTYRAIQHIDEDGYASYYTPDGESLRRTFLRTPIPFSRVTSHFSKRRFHPILKKWKAHKGVDYGASRGTPILATADGTVTFVGRKGGYGKTVKLKHGNTYTTLYAHMSGFAKKIKKGRKVRQGQTIGYVGRTGYATGTHLHYEFRINGNHRDPLKVKLPRALPIDGEYRADFLEYAKIWDSRMDAVTGHYLAINR